MQHLCPNSTSPNNFAPKCIAWIWQHTNLHCWGKDKIGRKINLSSSVLLWSSLVPITWRAHEENSYFIKNSCTLTTERKFRTRKNCDICSTNSIPRNNRRTMYRVVLRQRDLRGSWDCWKEDKKCGWEKQKKHLIFLRDYGCIDHFF